MSNTELKQKVLKLLNRRYDAGFIPRKDTYENYKYKILYSKIQKKTLDSYYTTFKALKSLDVKLSKKNFSDVYRKAGELTQEIKVTVFGNFKYTYPQSKNVHKNAKMTREAVDTFVVKGNNKKTIKKMIQNKLEDYEDYANDIDSSHKVSKQLDSIDYERSAVPMKYIPLNKIPMKNSFVLQRDWLKYAEGIDKKAYENHDGQCVYELLSEHLSNPAKRINMTKDKLFGIFNEFYQSQKQQESDLDAGLDVYLGNFTIDSGVSTDMIHYLCEQRKISLYAFDVKENCFDKVIYSHTSNYRPIVYYLVDGHMYLITNKDVIKSLTSANKINKNTVVSSMLEMDDEPQFENIPINECKSFAEAILMKDCIVYLPFENITTDVHQYIRETKNVPRMKVLNHQIIQVKMEDVTIICDPNIADECTWKDIKAICEKADIPFRNQRIGGLISNLRKKFFKVERRTLNDDEKQMLIQEQESTCLICNEKSVEFEYDHIQSLANGGSNDIDNFQALCKPCHLNKTMEERENSDFIKFDTIASTFNEKALEIIQSQDFKQWAFIEKLFKKEISLDGLVKVDHAKCRRNLVMHSKFDYPMYSVMDYPTEYDGSEIKCGFYFVESKNYFPLRGNGWYNYAMVKYCIENQIEMKITHQFIPSFTIKNDYFKNFAEFMIQLTEGSNLGKLIVNSLVGCWGIQSTNMECINHTTDKYEASRELCRDGVFVSSNKLSHDVVLYSIIEKFQMKKDDMFLPLYNQIVALEAIELHRLEQLIKSKGGEPMERNTDAILYRGDKMEIKNYFWDDEKTVFKYRFEEPSLLCRDSVCSITRTRSFVPASFEYFEYAEPLDNDFSKLATQIFESNKSCNIDGISGAGKTTLANMVIQLIEKSGKSCIKLAPTNKAREHLGEGAMTIHKYYLSLFLSNNYEKKLLKNLNNVDYIIIDEISMVKELFYRFFVLIKRYVPHVKFIIIGDYKQLKPVNDIYHGNYNGPALHGLVDGMRISLKQCRRSDAELFSMYTNIGSVEVSRFPVRELTDLNIAYTHKTRKEINKQCIAKFSEGKEWLPANRSAFNKKTQFTKLFVGLPIVAHRNFKKEEIYNSEVFTITVIDWHKKTFSFLDGETSHTYSASQFSSMFYPAFCVTVHVSQGCTFSKPYTVYDWNHPRMDETAKYVALSRATSIKNIQIQE